MLYDNFQARLNTYLDCLRLEEQHTRRRTLPDAIDANACAPELLHADNAIKEFCKWRKMGQN